jgi:hypothetical protein
LRISLRWLTLAVLSLLLILDLGCSISSDPSQDKPNENRESSIENRNALPPLVVETSAPLLLDEPGEGQGASVAADTQAAAKNTACFVCHANYRSEFLVSRHAAADIGCSQCHGESLAHKNDENNTTPPQTMYSADKIDPFCRGCHKTHDVPAPKVVARWVQRSLDKADPGKIVCTDCHGEHRMKVRTVIWDKQSGKLLRTNRGD